LIVRGIKKRVYLHHSPRGEIEEVESVLIRSIFNGIHRDI
jgi:hypothetical protein